MSRRKEAPDSSGRTFLQPDGLASIAWTVWGKERPDGTRRMTGELRATDGGQSITLCDDIEAAENALLALTQYARALKRVQAWADEV